MVRFRDTYRAFRTYPIFFRLQNFGRQNFFNPLNAELISVCHLLALVDHHILHVSRLRVNFPEMSGLLVSVSSHTQFFFGARHVRYGS